jgi:hypothetical protein
VGESSGRAQDALADLALLECTFEFLHTSDGRLIAVKEMVVTEALGFTFLRFAALEEFSQILVHYIRVGGLLGMIFDTILESLLCRSKVTGVL